MGAFYFSFFKRASSLWFVTARPLFFAALSFLYFWNATASLADQYEGVGAGSGTLAHRARASLRPASEVRTKKTERERGRGREGESACAWLLKPV